MNDTEIKACPFCGSQGKLTTTTCDRTIGHRHTVICSPGCGGSGQVAASPELALEAWNQRAGDREPEAAQTAETIAGSLQRPCYPALPSGMTRQECIEGLKELRNDAVAAEKERDPCFNRWPDLDALLEYIEANGFPAPDNEKVS